MMSVSEPNKRVLHTLTSRRRLLCSGRGAELRDLAPVPTGRLRTRKRLLRSRPLTHSQSQASVLLIKKESMKLQNLLLLMLLTMPLNAQNVLSGGSVDIIPGNSGSVSISLQSTELISGVQFRFPITVGMGVSISGVSSLIANKIVSCVGNMCLMIGFNQDPLPNGDIMQVAFLTDDTFDGLDIPITDIQGTDPDGLPVTIVVGTPVRLLLGPLCPDLNNDNLTNVQDVQIIINSAISGQCG